MAATRLSNGEILEQLRQGVAEFELVSSPFSSTPTSNLRTLQHKALPFGFLTEARTSTHHFFARIGPSLGGGSQALKKVERYSIQRVTDELRLAVKEVICDNNKEREKYEEALVAITVDESLKRYCQRIGRSDFWGGESELLVLSRLLCQPVVVYIPEHEHSGRGSAFIPIAEYGSEFCKGTRSSKPRQAVKLLYSGRNHYDLLV